MTYARAGELEPVPTVWELNALPPLHPRYGEATVRVHWLRRRGRVFMADTQHYTVNRSGGWDITPSRSDQDDDWFTEHTFTERGAAFAAARIAAAELAARFTRS